MVLLCRGCDLLQPGSSALAAWLQQSTGTLFLSPALRFGGCRAAPWCCAEAHSPDLTALSGLVRSACVFAAVLHALHVLILLPIRL